MPPQPPLTPPPPPFLLATIRAVTFDCYGTLVDWESGIKRYVAPHLERAARAGIHVTPEAWLRAWEPIQFELIRPGQPWRPYREILEESWQLAMKALELECFADGGPGLVRSLSEWPAFGDTVPALRRMARRRRLAIVSNVDRALLAETLGRLQAPFSALITAEDARAYKPDEAPFALALARLGLPPASILHAAFGWRYDLGPARRLGLRTCFVNRAGHVGHAASVDGAGAPAADLEVPSLATLADWLDGSTGG